MTVKIIKGDCREILRDMPAESVHCVVTSPPYFGLRDYGVAGQIGLESTPDAFVDEMVAVFRSVRRVLRDDGTVWLNLGDSYAGSGKGGNPDEGKQATNRGSQTIGVLYGTGKTAREATVTNVTRRTHEIGMKPKDLIGVPWRVAFALQADGWYLRQDIIWSKPNPMPESVRDRCTKAHEYLFMLSKSARYQYDADAIAEDAIYSGLANQDESGFKDPRSFNGKHREGYRTSDKQRGHGRRHAGFNDRWDSMERAEQCSGKRNKRSVWEVATAPFPEAHFATFPPALIEPCILAGCPEKVCAKCGAPWVREVERERQESERVARGKALTSPRNDGNAWNENSGRGFMPVRSQTLRFAPTCSCARADADGIDFPLGTGTVLDPFGGAGTTGLVADRLGRDAILIELNPEYAAMADRRIKADAGMFASVEG